MGKSKTKKSAAKRFKITGSGKVRRHKAYKSHLLGGKTRKRKRNLRKPGMVHKTEQKKVKRMLPYG